MVLLITKNVNLLDEVNSSRLYIRLEAKLEFNGTKLSVSAKNYLSKASFTNNSEYNNIRIQQLPEILKFDYNRSTEGADILEIAHTKFREWISTDKTKEIVRRDPSTSARSFDPSTGALIMDIIVLIPKYAEENEITIDLD